MADAKIFVASFAVFLVGLLDVGRGQGDGRCLRFSAIFPYQPGHGGARWMMTSMQRWKRAALIAASVVVIVAMVVVWVWVDLGTADGTASVIGASAGVIGLAYALLSGNSASSEPTIKAVRSGKATATGGGMANTGVTMPASNGGARASAEDTGEAESDGSGDANTGIRIT